AKTRNPRPDMELAGAHAAVRLERSRAPSELVLGVLMDALPLPERVAGDEVQAATGQPVDPIDAVLSAAVERGWIMRDPAVLRATPVGYALLNEVLELFVEPTLPR